MERQTNHEPTETVNAIGTINFQGNVIPQSWFGFVKLKSGKPDVVAIILLAEFIYWYRPTEIFDDETKKVTGWKKKFDADKLQYSYAQMVQKFGITKKQATRACANLKKLGLIGIELRIIQTLSGPVSNVMYIDVKADKILDITYGNNSARVIPPTFKGDRVSLRKVEHTPLKEIPPPFEGDTYTKITSKTTTKNTTKITKEEEQEAPKNGAPLFADEKKIRMAEYVLLAAKEKEELSSKFGDEFLKLCVDRLDNYKGASGKKYKSDYRAILNWVVRAVKEDQHKEQLRNGGQNGKRYDRTLEVYESAMRACKIQEAMKAQKTKTETF